MADISLKYYIEKLDSLLSDGAHDAVIFHCHHILQHYPKNIEIYQRLGQALLLKARWEDAIEVLNRVLSVYPDDGRAHAGLGQAYQHLRRPDDAIWHYERAHEDNPRSKAVTQELIELYTRHRGLQIARLPLTTGAVARQYIRNGLYAEAIKTLRQALVKSPRRVDLMLLLARVYREAGQHLDASEVALDVLKLLPDCLEANTMLVQLWLQEQRPTDAQRYLSRIEPVAPYFALQLAQGVEPDENVITLPEADYQTAAQRQLTQTRPDWVEQIDTGPLQSDVSDEADEITDEAPDMTAFDTDDVDQSDEMDDLLGVLEAFRGIGEEKTMIAASPQPDAESPSDVDEIDNLFSFDFDDDTTAPSLPDFLDSTESAIEPDDAFAVEDAPPVQRPARPTGLTGLLSALGDQEAQQEQEEEDASFVPEEVDVDSLFTDDLSEELDFDTEVDFDEFEGDLEEDSDLEWLQTDDLVDATTANTAHLVMPSSDSHDPLAWMRDAGVEIDDSIDEEPESVGLVSDELQEPGRDDPLAWLKSSQVELVEDEDDVLSSDAGAEEDKEGDDPLAWLKSTGSAVLEDEQDELFEDVQPPQQASQEPVTQDETPDVMGWLQDDTLLDEMLDVEALQDTSIDNDSEMDRSDDMPKDNDDLNWLNEDDENDDSDFTDEQALDWMSDPGDVEPSGGVDDGEAEFDWSAELKDNQGQAAAGSVPDLFGDDADDDEEADDTPDFFSDEVPADEFAAANEFSMSDDDGYDEEDETPDWLMDAQPQATAPDDLSFDFDEDEPEAEFEAEEDTPDWLSAVGAAGVGTAASAAAMAAFGDDDEDEPEAEFEAEEDAPDWLSAVGVADDDDGYDEEDEDLLEPVSQDETPDWLMDAQPQAAVPDDLPFDFDEDDTAPAPATDIPEWLSNADDWAVSDEDEAEEAAPMMAQADDEADLEPVQTDMPDWLMGLSEDDEDEAEDVEPAAVIAAAALDESVDVLPAENAPDWLNAMVPGLDVDFEAEEDRPIEQEYLREAEDTERPSVARAKEEFAWLSEVVEAETVQPPQDLPGITPRQPRFVFSKAPAWLRDARDDEIELDEIGDDLPSWLDYDNTNFS